MGQLTTAAFTAYDPANAGAITAGPFALYTVSLSSVLPTQINEGFAEVNYKTAGYDDLTSLAAVDANLQGYIEPVVIGPDGALYLLDGHHTLTAVSNSVWGASNPTVYVNVVANYSNLTESQFWNTLAANNLVLPLNNGVAQTIDPTTGAPIPTSLTSLISDPYRGLEYSILKNKSSTLFPTAANITSAIGASTPGLDKITGFYSDFIWAQAYQDALSGLGLPYLSPGDIALATQWNLNLNNTTTEPVVGTVKVGQLPGAVLASNIAIGTTISDATLASGTLDAFGTFTGISSFTFGTTTLGTPRTGLILQLGADAGFTVTLTGTNTYTGGTTLIAGSLIIGSDAALGAAAPSTYTIDPANIAASVRAANGIIFNSLTEGNASITIGTTAGGGTATFTTNRPIAVDGEIATLNPNGNIVTLTGQIVSLGSDGTGIGNTTGVSDFTVNDTSSGAKGVVVIAPSTGSNSQFYGSWNIVAGTLRVSSDAALGNTTLPTADLGQIELNGGIFQTAGSFSSARSLYLASASTFDTDGNTTSWSGTMSDTQRALTVTNSSTTAAGAVTFGSFVAASTASLALNPGTSGLTVTLTNGFVRSGAATALIQPVSGSTLGSASLKLLAGTAPTLIHGIVSPWIITDSGSSTNPYGFVTYGANGYVSAGYSQTGSGSTGGIRVAGSSDVVNQTGNATLAQNAQAFALTVNSGATITATGYTVTLGDGNNPAGLILQGGAISGGTLAFGASEGVIFGSGTDSVTAAITGSGGLTFAGSGTVTLGAVSSETGAITVDSGGLTLGVANVFASDAAGVFLTESKKPAKVTLTFSTNQTFSALGSSGNNSVVNFSNGAVLTIGDSHNLSTALGATITETGAAVSGAIVKAGTGLLDLTGIAKTSLNLVAGSTIAVQGGQLRVTASTLKNATGFAVSGGAELQFLEKGGEVYAGAITGAGDVRLLIGTLKLTGTANTYSGGTFVETGSVLDLTTASVSSGNANIGDAGGIVDFDQNTNGTYSGVISDARLLGTGALQSGTLIKDDSTTDNAGVLKLTQVQAFSGYTDIEAGGIELGTANALALSAGVVLGRIGGGATASLTLDANQTLASLNSDASNTTSVVLGGNVLTLDPATSVASSFGGVISDGAGPGSVVINGAGTVTLTGANTYTGGTTLSAGTLELGNAGAAGTGAITFGAGATATLELDSGIAITNTVAGFAAGDTIDLAGLAFSASGGATLGAGNVLSITEGGTTEQIQLATGTSYAGDGFKVVSDGHGGVDVTLTTAPTLAVNGSADTVNAAGESSVAFAVTGLATGDAGTVTFTDSLGDTVAVAVTAGQTAYTADLSGLADGTITSSLTLAGQGYGATGNAVALHATLPSAPGALVDTTAVGGVVNAVANTAAQALTGTGAAGDTVTVYDGSTALATVTVAGDGTWSYTLGALSEGSHSLTATQTDSFGNTGAASAALALTVDTVAPTVAITATGGLTNQPGQTVSGTVDSADAGTTVTVYDGTTVLGTATVAIDGSWSTAVTLTGDGAHTLVATDTDAAGNTGSSSGVSYTLDTAAPTVAITATGGLTNQPGQTVSGTVDSADAGTTVTVYDGTTVLGTATVAIDGSWSTAVTLTGDGAHTLVATDTDAAGNTGSSSGVRYTLDTIAPVAPTGLADTGDTNGYVNAAGDTTTQSLTGTAEAGATVTVYDHGVAIGTAQANAAGQWSFVISVLGNGTQHAFTARATDAAGNTGAVSNALAFTVDTTVPTLADAAIRNGFVNADADTAGQTLTGTAEANAAITIYNNGVRIGSVQANSVGTWTFKLGKLAAGTDVLTAVSRTTAGVVNTSAALAFTVDIAAPAAPGGLADASANHGYVGAAGDTAAQTLTGTAEGGALVTVYDNGQVLGTTTAVNGRWSYALGVLADEAHKLTATATDAAGNTSKASAALQIQVITVAPAAPAGLADTAVIGGIVDTAHDTASQVLTGTAVPGTLVTIYENGVVLGMTSAAPITGKWGYKLGKLANGGYSFTATATDKAGNVSASSDAFGFTVQVSSHLGAASNTTQVGAPGASLVGGPGADVFAFHANFGLETITNFTTSGSAADVVQFDSSVFSDWAHLLGATSQVGSNLDITLDAHDVITLKNVSLASFTSSNARFV